MKKKKLIHKLPPYPSYDIENLEIWLEKMASQGWHLIHDGFMLGCATFERGKEEKVRYRFEASMKSTSMWADNNGEPEEEAVELNSFYGWEYVTKWKEFYVYRSKEIGSRELHTDPQVQALALREVCKRSSSKVFMLLFYLIIYPIFLIRNTFFLTLIEVGTGFMVVGMLLGAWLIFDSIKEYNYLNKMKKRLQNGESLVREEKEKKINATLKDICRIVVLIVWLFMLFTNKNNILIRRKTMPLKEDLTFPFATMIDFVEKSIGYQSEFKDMNKFSSWSDWLAPVNVIYSEHATIKISEDSAISGGLQIEYHELINSWLAQRVAQEYVEKDKKNRYFEEVECVGLDVDYSVTYLNELHFETVVLREGNKVIHAWFYNVSPTSELEFKEWVECVANHIKE